MDDDEYLTVEEAAEIARVRPRTILAWIAEGKLRAAKPGREYRIKRSWLDEMMEKARD